MMFGHGFKPYLSCGVLALPVVARAPQSPELLAALKVFRFESPVKLAGSGPACSHLALLRTEAPKSGTQDRHRPV